MTSKPGPPQTVLKSKAGARFDYEAKGKNAMGSQKRQTWSSLLTRLNKRLDEDPGLLASHPRLSEGWKAAEKAGGGEQQGTRRMALGHGEAGGELAVESLL